ncbi:hypothetical protein L596_013285 [Steinernema carpocapsae]|uniref:Uncharacterized protein n=1 Tax=Steinernema carpocapsae TaxID=34508 RepID=A0A4U5P0C5_STECR|nr:hypothetical protein L596_013285 [Steinernema carpocapsae]
MFPWWISALFVQLLSILSAVSSFGILCISKSTTSKASPSKNSAESLAPSSSVPVQPPSPMPTGPPPAPPAPANRISPQQPIPDSSASKSGMQNPQGLFEAPKSQGTQTLKSYGGNPYQIDKTQESQSQSWQPKSAFWKKVEQQLESIRKTKPRRKTMVDPRSLKKSMAKRSKTIQDKQDPRSRKTFSKKSSKKRRGSRVTRTLAERTQDTQTAEDVGGMSNNVSQNYAQPPPSSEDDDTFDGVKSVDNDEVPSDRQRNRY